MLFHRGLVAGRSFCALQRRRPPRESGRSQRSCWLPIDRLTCSPAQSSETAIRRGVELATFSSKRVWLALSRPHAFERIETSGLAGVPSTQATRGRGWHLVCKGTNPASEGQIRMNKIKTNDKQNNESKLTYEQSKPTLQAGRQELNSRWN